MLSDRCGIRERNRLREGFELPASVSTVATEAGVFLFALAAGARQVLLRIDRLIINANLIMEVRTSRTSG